MKLAEKLIFLSTMLVSNLPIYFSSAGLSMVKGALASACDFLEQNNTLRGAKPFGPAQQAHILHFQIYGTLLLKEQSFSAHNMRGFRHV